MAPKSSKRPKVGRNSETEVVVYLEEYDILVTLPKLSEYSKFQYGASGVLEVVSRKGVKAINLGPTIYLGEL